MPAQEREVLTLAYVRLARYIEQSDAEFLTNIDKAVQTIHKKTTTGQKWTNEEYEELSSSEEEFRKTHARIDREERELIADLAAARCGLRVYKTDRGYSILSADQKHQT
jgi:hypothetical protein